MTSKSFAERIAEVLIEDGLLLPNQLEEAVSIQQTEGGRLLKILTDKQFVTEKDTAFNRARRSGARGGRRYGQDEQAGADRALERETFRGNGRSNKRARG